MKFKDKKKTRKKPFYVLTNNIPREDSKYSCAPIENETVQSSFVLT